jgi:hypothetical protein
VGVGWFSACAAYRRRRHVGVAAGHSEPAGMAIAGAAPSIAMILTKAISGVPGSFTRTEWRSFAGWSAIRCVFWLLRPRAGIRNLEFQIPDSEFQIPTALKGPVR